MMEEDTCLSNQDEKINLTLLNGTGYIFNVDDYLFIRQKYRIVGSMVGTPSNHVLGTEESSLPVELSKYETALLLEKNVARLVAKAEYITNFDKNRGAMGGCNLKAEDDLCDSEAGNPEPNMNSPLSTAKATAIDLEPRSKPSPTSPYNLIEIACAHPDRHLGEVVRLTNMDEVKYRVFCDLWSRGNFITGGDSFGADFLLYPGDPMQFHASHIVILLPDVCIEPLDLISKVRVATVVNKHCLFAYFVQGSIGLKPELRYKTVLWQGEREDEEDIVMPKVKKTKKRKRCKDKKCPI